MTAPGDVLHPLPLRPAPDGLVDCADARRWLELLAWGQARDLYTYQQPLDGRSGPRVQVRGRPMLMLSAYDYLGLTGHPDIEDAAVAAVRDFGTGSGGVRMLTGTNRLHVDLEAELAAFKGVPAALSFGSGYLANFGAITALVGPRDQVLIDTHAHRSLHEACHLARVPTRTFRHNDMDALERLLARPRRRGRALIIVDGLYSMDGDVSPLPDLVALKRRFEAFLLVDEAHSLGVLGRGGRGAHEHHGLSPDCVDVWTGSLSKAVPSNGGFVAGSRELIVYLQHAGAPFWFSAALCPSATAAARAALCVLQREPERLERQWHAAQVLRDGLRGLGYDTGASTAAIVPVIVGSDEGAWRLARALFARGVIAAAVVYPAVPRRGARLRLCATAALSEADLREAIEAFAALATDPLALQVPASAVGTM
jgi:8-amino-7-oxononanoate synthase